MYVQCKISVNCLTKLGVASPRPYGRPLRVREDLAGLNDAADRFAHSKELGRVGGVADGVVTKQNTATMTIHTVQYLKNRIFHVRITTTKSTILVRLWTIFAVPTKKIRQRLLLIIDTDE